MENWIIVLLFVNGVIESTGHRILDTVCITKNPSNNPVEDVSTYGSVVAGYDVNIERSYRRAARTRFLDHYPGYPILENMSCNVSVIQSQRSTKSTFLTRFGFFKNTNAEVRYSDLDSGVLVDAIILGSGSSNVAERRNLTFGVFQCISSKLNYSNTATVTILSHEAVFRPLVLTVTANLNETVALAMTPSEGVQGSDIRWRYSWNSVTKEISDWTGNTSPVIDKVDMSHAGVYEAYTPSSNYSGYVRLIVRECPHNYWGPKPCRWTCPVCFNGGICDDISGACICPPGFYGKKCEQACEYGKIGQQCTMTCTQISTNEDCSGLEICLPDPFGCTCAPGFTGLDCQTVCAIGTYGASCLQTCNCKSNECNRYTGDCTGSPAGCSDGWIGSNCQQECNQGSFGADCLGTCHCLSGPCDRFTGACNSSDCDAGWTGPYCQDICPAPQFGFDCVEECNCQNATCDHVIGCTSSCNPGWAYRSSANCRIGIIGNGYTPQNPKITFPVTCTINKDNDESHDQLDLVLSRQENILDDSGITVNETSDNATARTIQFMVNGVSDGTSLYCQLRKNGSRRAVMEVPIDLYDLPVLQSAPTIEFVDNSSVTISWVPWNEEYDQGDSPVVGYIPYYFHHSAVDWINGSYVAADDNLTFTISDLDPDTRYIFSVAAVRDGEGGEGPKSPNITIKTICAAPVRGPTDVEAFISGDRQELVKISWKNPSVEDINCDAGVSKYTVYYSSGDILSSSYETREIFSPIDGTSVIFEDLVAGNTYNFQVTLTTEGGESSWNNPVDHLIPILPSLRNPPKVNYSCGHEVTITWNGWTEDEDDGTPPVIGYIPYHKLATTEQWIPSSLVHHEGDRLPMSYTFTDLSVSVRYNFALSVVREGHGGEGDMGEMVAYTTIHCEPGLPTGIIIGSISGGLLLLLLSLFVILLIKKRRSTKRHPSVDKTNAKAMEDLKLDRMNAYENTGISNKEDEEYDRNGSLYEMPSVNPNSDNIRSNSCKEFRMCDADYKGESNSVSHYENI